MFFKALFKDSVRGAYDSAAAYTRHLESKLRLYPGDRDLAFADAIGSQTTETFNSQGDGQVAILKYHGLRDGMSIYDLGCGCGRTAQALQRAGWRGHYIGADIVEAFVSELMRKCPGLEAHVHNEPTIVAADSSLDMLFHWSVYTHISPEECYLYLEDSFRALRNGGTVLFSFLEMSDPEHYSVFQERVGRLRNNEALPLLDTFLHRDWIKAWASRIGFDEPRFTHGHESTNHPAAWQSLAVMYKPA